MSTNISAAEFEKYSKNAIHFFDLRVPPLLDAAVKTRRSGFILLDLGCGDGNLVYALKNAGALSHAGAVIGIDLSPQRIERFTSLTGYRGVIGAIEKVEPIADASIDLVMSTMVIEHVPDDRALLREIKRMLKQGGLLYITTVLKLPGAWYFRRTPDGRWALDATHIREYPSRGAVEQLCEEVGLDIAQVAVRPLSFPLMHPILRILNRLVAMPGINKIFLHKGLLAWLGRITLPIPRYRTIELIARRRD
jgi:SAM-dependent methyltransferase